MQRRHFLKLLTGAMVAIPATGHAQQRPKIPTVGVLWHAGSREEEGAYYIALVEGFRDIGFVDGHNIRLEHRFPNETPEKFRSLAAELVSLKVEALVAVGGGTAPYAALATDTIPIVFVLVSVPAGSKLVAGIAAPGGNITGLSSFSSELTQKRLQLFKDVIPGLSRVAMLANPNEPNSRLISDDAANAAISHLGLVIEKFDVSSVAQLDEAFDVMERRGTQAVILAPGGLLYKFRTEIAKLGFIKRLPICAWSKETFESGVLMSYGPDYVGMVRRAPTYVDRILKGERPAAIPIEQPTKFQLRVNLRTAKAIGLQFPKSLLTFADEVIE